MGKEDEPAHMWRYWSDKKGRLDALVTYYPETLAQSMPLQIAIAQIEMACAAIDKIMEDLDPDNA